MPDFEDDLIARLAQQRQARGVRANPAQPARDPVIPRPAPRLDPLRPNNLVAGDNPAVAAAENIAAVQWNPGDFFFGEALKTTEIKKSAYDDQTMGVVWGIRVNERVHRAMKSHPEEIIKGIELEIENWPGDWHDADATGFSFTEDGSLRNNGTEAVSHPNNTKGLIAVTKALWEKFGITSEKNFSDRTSIHVHANVTDFTGAQFKALTLLYQVFEELLFTFIGNDRDNNIFCVPWCEAGVTAQNHARIIESPRGWNKYTALNLAPVATQGSVEFRHMHGHADIGYLSDWLHIIDDLLLSAKKTDYNTVIEQIQNINTTSQYTEFLFSIFPNTGGLLRTANFERKLSRGVIEAKLALVGA